jgi:glutamate-ammonia-ligase adenylyltransferase
MDIQGVMQGFKNAAHLRIGVRDLLGKESLESTHAALASTAESILRRTAEWTQRELADQYGDPVNDRGEPIDYVIVALGKLGGREPNYHSVLEAVFLVTGEGQTRRRVGGNRKTITTQDFFDELTLRLYRTVRDASTRSRMYDFATPLAISQSTADGRRVMSLDTLKEHFLNRRADLRDRLAICKARAISGRPESRTTIDAAIREMLIAGGWGTGDAHELLALRQGMEQTAAQDNLKRAVGGSVDVELATQGLQLKHASDHPEIVVPGTIEALGQIAEAGLIDRALATKLQGNYRFLREVESKLRLLDTPGRHEIPEDSGSLRRLAFLLNRGGSLKDAEQIVAQCRDVRADNRRLFNSVIGLLSE